MVAKFPAYERMESTILKRSLNTLSLPKKNYGLNLEHYRAKTRHSKWNALNLMALTLIAGGGGPSKMKHTSTSPEMPMPVAPRSVCRGTAGRGRRRAHPQAPLDLR